MPRTSNCCARESDRLLAGAAMGAYKRKLPNLTISQGSILGDPPTYSIRDSTAEGVAAVPMRGRAVEWPPISNVGAIGQKHLYEASSPRPPGLSP